jgi:SMI1-KNR4 cell-wall
MKPKNTSPSIFEAIEMLKQVSIDLPNACRGPTAQELIEAESFLEAPLPPAFKVFLAHAGSYRLPYWEIFWVGDHSPGDYDIIEANRSEREDADPALPSFLITFHNNGMGDQLCFDTRFPDQTGECPIVFWDHELSVDQKIDVVAGNFAEWLYHEAQRELSASS